MRLFRCGFSCLLLLAGGCNMGTRYPTLATPELQQQRQQAVRYDPYIDNDIGPEVDGGRPRDFGQQLPETVRSRWTR